MKEYPIKEIKLVAGEQNDGRPVMESILAVEPQTDQYQLLKSPAFVRGLARGDLIQYDSELGTHTVLKRSGNLSVRVFAKADIETLTGRIVPELEKLGGELDFSNERMLILSIHVSCGFTAIEDMLNSAVGDGQNAAWMYGNVYQLENGELVPMNWWQDLLKPE